MSATNSVASRKPTLALVSRASGRPGLRRTIALWATAFGCFPAGILLDRWIIPPGPIRSAVPFACFAGYLFFGRKALETRFPDLDRKWRASRRTLSVGLAAAIGVVPAPPARAQQTIFNIPSADVLDSGKLYLEEDNLWRPGEPRFALFAARGVVGLGSRVEAGINIGGFAAPGRSVPTATLAVKWQPYRAGAFAVTAGAHGLFFLRGAPNGTPGLHGYAHASYRFSTQTRLTAGGWFASSGYAATSPAQGALFGLEQPVGQHLALIADMYSGKSSIGYTTYGIEPTFGPWALYAGYSVKNGNSKGNAILFEIGFTH